MIRERLAPLPRQLTETQSCSSIGISWPRSASALVGTGADADRIAAEVIVLRPAISFASWDRIRYGHALYSTPETRSDRAQLAWARPNSEGSYLDRGTAIRLDRACAAAGLSAEQRSAARAATGGTAVTVIEGWQVRARPPALKLITAEYAEQGKRVLATATAWRTAHMLRDELGSRPGPRQPAGSGAGGQVALDNGTVACSSTRPGRSDHAQCMIFWSSSRPGGLRSSSWATAANSRRSQPDPPSISWPGSPSPLA